MTTPVAAATTEAPTAAQREPGALPSASVIIPAYNEEALIVDSLTTVHEYLETLDGEFRWEIVVVDDGSTDATGRLADDFAASHDHVRVLHHRVNFNLGQALRYGFDSTRSDYLVTLDADLSYGPEHVGRLLRTIEDTQARIVIASPYVKGGATVSVPFTRRVASRWANRLLSRVSREGVATLTGMTRAYDRRFLQSLDLKAMDSEINTEIIYKAQLLRARIVEIPATLDWTSQRERQAERKSSVRMRRSTLTSIVTSFLFHPFLFFIGPGLVVGAMASWMILWICIRLAGNYGDLTGGFDPRFSDALFETYREVPYQFVVGGIALTVAIQLLSLGIISLQAKRYFEELFHLGSTVLRRVRLAEEEQEDAR